MLSVLLKRDKISSLKVGKTFSYNKTKSQFGFEILTGKVKNTLSQNNNSGYVFLLRITMMNLW